MNSEPLGVPSISILNSLVLDQSRLDVADRSRTSRLPWRGQFSPELVEYLLEAVCPDADTVLDPFCGSGTVLFEVAQRGGFGLGAEVNPAAWHLASLISFCSLTTSRQTYVRQQLRRLRESVVGRDDLFSGPLRQVNLGMLFDAARADPALRTYIAAAVLLGMGDKLEQTAGTAFRGLLAVEKLLDKLTAYSGRGACHLEDARSTNLETGSVEAVITSPPYINVFNYHQNYRPAVELIGWQPLQAAVSEIGANRKHRGNRFLTVVQYCLDMAQALDEIARVCRPGAPVVLVVGRESNVLGAAFHNGDLLRRLMRQSGGSFELGGDAERVFTNRFGQRIYEDVIISRHVGRASLDLSYARAIGVEALDTAISSVPDQNRPALDAARSSAEKVEPSRLLSLSYPELAA